MPPSNVLPFHGNEKTMNLNSLILANIQASPYFKVQLYELKTYHQVIDEIYTRANHLEPWEKGSRKTAGQTGMCGGVRGVGAGGIVSSSFCLLYKLFTLKLTRKQLIGLCTHTDSPFIRGIGLMYARFTLPPSDLWDWFESYLDDEEEIDVKAGGGHVMTIGDVATHFLTKLEWYSTLFPRIPVPIQKQIEQNLLARKADRIRAGAAAAQGRGDVNRPGQQEVRQPNYERRNSPVYGRYDSEQSRSVVSNSRADAAQYSGDRDGRPAEIRRRSPERERRRSRSTERRSRPDDHYKSSSRRRSAERDRDRQSRPSDRYQGSRRSPDRHYNRDRERSRQGDRERQSHRSREHRHSQSHSRHGSRSHKDSKDHDDRSTRDRKSPVADSQRSRSPKTDDPFEQDLKKELQRVGKSRSSEEQNGSRD